MLNGTGYCNLIFYLLNEYWRWKFTYLISTKPHYLLQSPTATKQQHRSNYCNLLVNFSWISNYIIVHNVYNKTSVPHRQIVVQWSNCHTVRFQPDTRTTEAGTHLPTPNGWKAELAWATRTVSKQSTQDCYGIKPSMVGWVISAVKKSCY